MKPLSFYITVLFLLQVKAMVQAQAVPVVHVKATAANNRQPADTSKTFTILSYNIHHGADKNEVNRLDSMGAFIRSTGADIVCLQEVDSVCKRSGHINQIAVLAAAAKMQGVDYILFDDGLVPVKNETFAVKYSDHLPILRTFKLP